MLTIRLFGPPQLHRQDRPVVVTRRKSRALLFYLAASSEPVQRERLLPLLWPDDDRAAAQHSLRTTVYGLRQILDSALEATGDTLALAQNVEVDVRHFSAGLAAARISTDALQSALALYRGAFLETFSLPDSAVYEAWLTSTRQYYHQRVVDGLHTLAQVQAQRDVACALSTLGRALDLDPLREDLHRTAMQLQYKLGDRAGAIRRFEHLRRLLDDELGLPPMPDTQALYDALITDTLDRTPPMQLAKAMARPITFSERPWQSAASGPSLLPFVGRQAQLDALRQLTTTAQLVLIEGEAGIGKTRLAQEFIRSSPALVLFGAAHELERALPYQPIRAALRTLLQHPAWPALRGSLGLAAIWRAEVARLVPEFADAADALAAPVSDEARLWESVSQLLHALAREQPLLLVLDDLHWADVATLGLLGYLVRQAADGALAFIATAQPVSVQSPLAGLTRSLSRVGRLTSLPLARLGATDVARLAQTLNPVEAAPLSAWLLSISEGNPFVLTELVRDVRNRQGRHPQERLGYAVLAGLEVPQTVTAMVAGLLAQLTSEHRRVLDIAVAIGREFSLDVVAQAAGLSEAAALDAIEAMRAADLVMPRDGMRYAFDHSLTMQVAAQEVGPARHALCHRLVAEAIEKLYEARRDELAERLALHWAAGGQPERAAPYAWRAGGRAAQLAAWHEAAAFYKQALACSSQDDQQRPIILLALGRAQYAAGDAVEASASFLEALQVAEAQRNASSAMVARLELGVTYLPQARYRDVVALMQDVLASAREEHHVQAQLLWGTALAHEGQDLDAAMTRLQAAELLITSEAQPDSTSLAHVLFELGGVAAQQGDLEQACARYRAVLTVAHGASFPTADQWAVLALNNLSYHLHLLGNPSAQVIAEDGLHLAEERGLRGLQTYLRSTLGEIALAAGDLSAAESYFRMGLGLAEERRQAERVAGITANLGRVAAARGARDEAVELLLRACSEADALRIRHLAAQIRVWLAPLLPAEAARARLAEARALAEPSRCNLLQAIDQEAARLAPSCG